MGSRLLGTTGRERKRFASLRTIASLLSTGAILATAGVSTARERPDLVLANVSVIDTRTGMIASGMDVRVQGDKIVSIARANPSRRRNARVINARSQFVVPGYNDMHAHPLNDSGAVMNDDLALMLAFGVTGYRQMSGTPERLRQRRSGAFANTPDKPALLAMPGEVLTSANSRTPAEAIAQVDRQKREGADFIKLTDVSPAIFTVIGDEAHKVGLPFLGHLPNGVDPVAASAAGFRSVEHLGPMTSLLVGCSTEGDAVNRIFASLPARPAPAIPADLSAAALGKLAERGAAAPLVRIVGQPGPIALLGRVADSFDEAKCRHMADAFVANGTWQAPTLIRDKTLLFPDDPGAMRSPALRYVPIERRTLWAELARQYGANATPAARTTLQHLWAAQLRMLKIFDAAGVPMLTGTDIPGQWDIPGVALHDEFDLLAEAGVKPLKILQMTTLNAGIFLGREKTMGQVAVGADADLVLLDGNPVISVANLHKVNAVVRAGRYYSAAALDGIKSGVARNAAQPQAGLFDAAYPTPGSHDDD